MRPGAFNKAAFNNIWTTPAIWISRRKMCIFGSFSEFLWASVDNSKHSIHIVIE